MYKGRQIFFEAIEIFCQMDDVYITKDVYHTLAKRHGLSCSQVEGRITTIINYLWQHCDLSHFGFY